MRVATLCGAVVLSCAAYPTLAIGADQSVGIRSDANTVGTAFFDGWNFIFTDDCPQENTCKFRAMRVRQGFPLEKSEGLYGNWPPSKGQPPSLMAMTMRNVVHIIPISKIKVEGGKKWRFPPPNAQ